MVLHLGTELRFVVARIDGQGNAVGKMPFTYQMDAHDDASWAAFKAYVDQARLQVAMTAPPEDLTPLIEDTAVIDGEVA